MPHSPSNEYLDGIYHLRDVFLENMKDDKGFMFFCQKEHLDKNDWIDLYVLSVNKIKNYIDMSSCLWNDFDWIFTELVEANLKHELNDSDKKIRISLYGFYIKNKDKILLEVYYGDISSFFHKNFDDYFSRRFL